MRPQFTDLIEPKDGLDESMMKDVQADETQKEITGYFIGFRYRHTIMINPCGDIIKSRTGMDYQWKNDFAS